MKISLADYWEFIKLYYLGVYEHQRLGQAFCNRFFIQGESELFYQENNKLASLYIVEHYVED